MEETREFINGFLEQVCVILKDRGIKKRVLAESMGMKAPHLVRVLSGQKMPSIAFLVKLESALGVKIDLVIRDVPRETKVVINKDSSLGDKLRYCKSNGISLKDLENRLKEI